MNSCCTSAIQQCYVYQYNNSSKVVLLSSTFPIIFCNNTLSRIDPPTLYLLCLFGGRIKLAAQVRDATAKAGRSNLSSNRGLGGGGKFQDSRHSSARTGPTAVDVTLEKQQWRDVYRILPYTKVTREITPPGDNACTFKNEGVRLWRGVGSNEYRVIP